MRTEARHVVLCGLSGAGKSTVGKLVAAALNRPFVDIDAIVEREAGVSIATLFARDGEAAFRAHEREVASRWLASAEPVVISLGGGALENDATLADAREHFLVWLDAPVELLVGRLRRDDRPLLAGDPLGRLTELAARRRPRYAQAALRVDASSESDAVAAQIAAAFGRPAEQAV